MSAAVDLLAGLLLEDGRAWGEVAAPFQWQDATAILDPGPNDPLLHFVTRPRGGSKTTDLAGVALAALVDQVPPGGRVFIVATDRDQARLDVDAIDGFVRRTPGLSGAVVVDRYQVTTTTGARLEVIPADAASSYGLRGCLFIVEEVTVWPQGNQAVWTSIISAVPKVPGCRLVCLGSSGDPSHWSYKVRERARVSEAWRLHEVPGPVPWISPDALEEQKALLTDSQYARLHLNIWTAAEDRLVSVENLRACVRLDGPLEPKPGQRYVCGLDLGLKNDRSVAAICHREGDEVVLDRIAVWQGTPSNPVVLRLVEEWIIEAARRYKAEVIADPWQATGLLQRLKVAGVKASEYVFSAQSVGRLAVTLHTCIRDHRLALPNDEELIDELANVRLKESSPNVYRLDHDPDRHDDRAVALALCALHLLERPAPGGWCRTWGADACAQCGRVYPSKEKACPQCGNVTPERDETPNEWAAVYTTKKDEGGPGPARSGWFG